MNNILTSVNKISIWAPPGKIDHVPVWNMTCKIWPVISVDQEIIPGGCILDHDNKDNNFDQFEISMTYDQQLVFQGNFDQTNPIVIHKEFPDDKQNTEHVFGLSLSGKTDKNNWIYQGKKISLCVKFELTIEDMSMDLMFEEQRVKSIQGENKTEFFHVQTPIYRWLLKNQHHCMPIRNRIYKT